MIKYICFGDKHVFFVMNKLKKRNSIELPYERSAKYGVHSLTDQELIALILRTGTKDLSIMDLIDELYNDILKDKGLKGLLMLSKNDLKKYHGIGDIKATQILALSEIVKRVHNQAYSKETIFDSPQKIAEYYLLELNSKKTENIVLLCLDNQNHKIHDEIISIGNAHTAIISPREILVSALKHNAVNIVLLHNHPGGNPKPSPQDILTTKNIMESADIVGIKLLDHIIIGNNSFISLNQSNILKFV